ncbi:hypothetical protein [Sulfoacidibacillus ferrooxidans]|uniref:Uncharacterized protein n=1 Tax=Sulfoacidibacillus ferrooxidans TaxID=2005001 RepID=A0A9X2AD77_9BACL|nr:hypothetical protein [Sulfoacidibacillus ferrooxidans]MCI0184973.1 hypothetical protein [Sulfoacidibacillus ferrooxidans]
MEPLNGIPDYDLPKNATRFHRQKLRFKQDCDQLEQVLQQMRLCQEVQPTEYVTRKITTVAPRIASGRRMRNEDHSHPAKKLLASLSRDDYQRARHRI